VGAPPGTKKADASSIHNRVRSICRILVWMIEGKPIPTKSLNFIRAVAQLETECDHIYVENGLCFECDSPDPRANLMVRSVGGVTLVDKLP
jgi:hypothetical protein